MGHTVSPAATKAEVRRVLLASRRALTPVERQEKSRRICATLSELSTYLESPVVSTYVNFRDEVETGDLIRALLSAGRRVAVPAHFHGVDLPLIFSEIRSMEELAPNHFGIPQPTRKHLRILPISALSLFLIPGVGFDISCRRLGYGLGFYDRVLPEAHPRARKIGLAFEAQMLERLPVDPHDIPMDCIITEHRLITAPSCDGAFKEVE